MMNSNYFTMSFSVTNSNQQTVDVIIDRDCYLIHPICRLPHFLTPTAETRDLVDGTDFVIVNYTLVELMQNIFGIEEFKDTTVNVMLNLTNDKDAS